MRPRRRAIATAMVALVASAVAGGITPVADAAHAAPAAPGQAVPVPVVGPDAALAKTLDAVVALAPGDTCLVVSVDGTLAYDHRGSDLQAPASNQKLLTASAVLDRLGTDRTLQTRVEATAPVAGGVETGNLVLVGGGDPVLVTDAYRSFRKIGTDQATTSLDALADRIAASGLRRVQGNLVVDDSRYDALRTVPSWPARYVSQNQSGPLGALVVDDGYVLKTDADGRTTKERASDPAVSAGDELRDLLADRGVTIAGPTVRGASSAGATVVATADSPTTGALVQHLLKRSDNQVAELLLKELGHDVSGTGSTAAGAVAVASWATKAGAASPGTKVVDGSGLDPTNATTCTDLVKVLDTAGPDGTIGQGLPVAGESGTLIARFRGSPAQGNLRAKTGSLGQVSALSGFVDLPEGGTATFSFVANGATGTSTTRAEAFLGQALATWKPSCPASPSPQPLDIDAPLVAPALALAQATGLGGLVSSPGTIVALEALTDPSTTPIDRCSRSAGVEVALVAA